MAWLDSTGLDVRERVDLHDDVLLTSCKQSLEVSEDTVSSFHFRYSCRNNTPSVSASAGPKANAAQANVPRDNGDSVIGTRES